MSLPASAAVLGSGAGALTIAAELELKGVPVTLADFPEFGSNLESVRVGGIVSDGDWRKGAIVPVTGTSTSPAEAAARAELVIVSVPSFGHARFAEELASAVSDGQMILWIGEGGGAFTMVSALKKAKRRPSVLIGESNTLPYVARLTGPATVHVRQKSGGTLFAALPASDNEAVVATAEGIWSWATAAENVWETILLNYNAIDHVPPLLCNLGAIEGGTGVMLLWRDGATPGVVNVIEAVDGELLAIRRALGLANGKRYADYLVEQGMAPCLGSLHEMIQASRLAAATVSCGPAALNHRFLTEDVPYALTLAASIGAELGVATPVIHGLVAIATAATRAEWGENQRTLATWDLEGAGREGLVQAATEGWW